MVGTIIVSSKLCSLSVVEFTGLLLTTPAHAHTSREAQCQNRSCRRASYEIEARQETRVLLVEPRQHARCENPADAAAIEAQDIVRASSLRALGRCAFAAHQIATHICKL